mmetsp:Transcript_32830/g.48150  ORF Transcript_32830/g.48150 Transcript_32830/m.48150 type:complete len:415 (+) Transcript_32830:172-1416(+)
MIIMAVDTNTPAQEESAPTKNSNEKEDDVATITTEKKDASVTSSPSSSSPDLASLSSSSSLSSSGTTATAAAVASKWKIKSTPQDSSFIPTLGVTFWMGWNFVLIFLQCILFLPFTSSVVRTVIVVVCTMSSLVLPANFVPFGLGYKFGDWMLLQGEKYFGLTTIIEDEESLQQISDQNKAAIFSFEPHDLLPYPVFAFNPALQRMPGKMGKVLHCLTSSIILRMPFIRHIYTWVRVSSVDKNTFRSFLQKGESVVFVPGGVHELTYTDPLESKDESKQSIVLYLKKRKGFIKLALENGSPIVPVFGFHIEDSYGYVAVGGDGFLATLGRSTGVLPIFFWGRFGIPFGIPRPNKITVAIGKPIHVPKYDNTKSNAATMEELVEKYHEVFLKEMESLFERHKESVGWSHKKLKII